MYTDTMPQHSTKLPKWQRFVDALGGSKKTMELLGISSMTLHRLTHGVTKNPSKDLAAAIRFHANLNDVPYPLDPPPSLERLELLGAALAHGRRPRRAIEHCKKFYDEDELIRLAEDDSSSENVLRAVTELLGGP